MKQRYDVRKISISAMIGILCMFILCGCSSNKQLQLGGWKENLYVTQSQDKGEPIKEDETHPETDKSPVAESIIENTDSAFEELAEIGKNIGNTFREQALGESKGTSVFDKLKDFNNSGIDYLMDETVNSKLTVEENGLIKVELIKVVDGDTLLVNYKDEIYIRLIGINTPESVHPDESLNTSEGEDASTYTKELLKDKKYVWLEFDTNLYDNYDRVLAYVWIDTDKSDINNMLNAKLLKDGTAEIMSVEPNVKYKEEFDTLVKQNK